MLPPPPKPHREFAPPPNNMFRGRGNWRHYHQNTFSHERDDRPYRRRRSHLDDIYYPNYEDNDDLNESDEINNYQQERFDNRRINRWDVRHRIPHAGNKQEIRKRCLISTKSYSSTSKDCVSDNNKTIDECKDSAAADKCCVGAKAIEQNVASVNTQENVCDKVTNKDSLTDERNKIKDSKKQQCLNYSKEKDKENNIVVSKKNIDKPSKQAVQVVKIGEGGDKGETKEIKTVVSREYIDKTIKQTDKISEIRDNGGVVGQNIMKTDANSSKHCKIDCIKPNAEINSVTNTVNPKKSNNWVTSDANVENACINASKQNKTDDQSSTHRTSTKEPFLVIDDYSRKGCPSKKTAHTPLSDERTDVEQKAVTLPLEFPIWELSPSKTNNQNVHVSVREIGSDEETIYCDQFIALDSIDTAKSYLDKDNFGPEFDDYRVTDMIMGTPSPSKRKCEEKYEDVVKKKTKYDQLYEDINSDQILNEINEVLREDEQKGESTTAKCIKRCRSKSFNNMQPKEKDVLRRCRSLHSIDQGHSHTTYNFDARTNLLVLLGNQKPAPMKISDSDCHHDGLKCSDIPQHSVAKDTTDKQNENTNDTVLEKLNRNEKAHEMGSRKGNEIESISNEAKEKVGVGKIDIARVSKESETKNRVEKANNEIKLAQDAAVPIKPSETGFTNGDKPKCQTNNWKMEKFDHKEHKSISNGHVSREVGPKRNVDLKTTKFHSSTDSSKSAGGSSDKGKKTTEDRRKEKRTNDEAKKGLEIAKMRRTEDHQQGTSDSSKKSSSLVRYSDYKKSVNLLEKSAPPEMRVCSLIGSPKKLSIRRMAFSNENELHHQKMERLFGNDFFDDETNIKCGIEINNDDKCGDGKSDSKKRKCEKDASTHKREPQPKKLFSEPNEPGVSKAKSLDKARGYSVPGTSTNEGGREAPNTVEVTKSERQSSNNTSQKAHSSAATEKPKQSSASQSNYKISHKSKNIDKSRRTSTPATSSEDKRERKRLSMPLSSVPQGTSTSQKAQKPEDDKKKDKNSKHVRAESLPRTSSTESTETSRLNIDVGKSQSCEIKKDSKRLRKQDKSHTNPKVVRDNSSKKNHKDLRKDDKEGKSSKAIDKNNKSSIPSHESAAKGRETHKLNKDLCENITKTTDDIQKDRKQNPAIVQKQLSHSKTDSGISPNNSTTLQPQLVLNKIDSQISNTIEEKKKELPVRRAIESFALEPNYVTCTTLAKDRFPIMQKYRSSFAENECCDRAAVLESPDVTDKMEIVKQPVASSKDDSKEGKESSDDVIEIKPDIPVIDLTDEGSDVKDENEDPPTDTALKSDKKVDVADIAVDNSTTANGEERITLYRSDETLNSSLEVQAMVASISPNAVRNNDTNKKCDDIKPDDEPVEIVEDKTTSASQAVSTTPRALPVPIPQETPLNNCNSLIDLLIERAINQGEQQISNSNIAGNNRPQGNAQGVCNSGTYAPPTGVLENYLCKSTSATACQNSTIPDSNKSSSINKNVMAAPPTSSPIVHRRKSDVTNASISVAQSPRRRQSDADQITVDLTHQTPRGTENNADAQSSKLPSGPQYSTTQVPSSNMTTQSSRRTENNRSEQNLVTAMVAQCPRQAQGNTTPIYNVLVGNRRTVNVTSNQSLYSAGPGSTRIENNPQVEFNSSAGTENSTGTQFAAAQTPRGVEIANNPVRAGVAQSLRVDSSSNECNICIMPAANSRTMDCNTNQVTLGVVACGTSNEQNMSASNVNEQRCLANQSPRRNNNDVDGPLRALHQLANGPGATVESEPRKMKGTGSILIKYVFYLDGHKKAQMAYCEQLKKVSRFLPTFVRSELIEFEASNSARLYKLSADLIRDLKLLRLTMTNNLSIRLQMIIEYVYNSIKEEVPNLTKSWVYLLLEALIKPEAAQYLEVPFLAALCRHVTAAGNQIRMLSGQNQGLPGQNQGAAQNNLPPQDLFTPEQRRQLERQLQQYKTICTNQVFLFRIGDTLQNNLLRAHQNNQINKANQQNKQSSIVNRQNKAPSASGGSVPIPVYDVPGPPNVSLPNDIPRNPVAPQQENPSLCSTQNCEALKNILLSGSSSKKSSTRPSHASATAQASKQPSVGASSSSNVTILANVALNSTITAPTSRMNQPNVPSNVCYACPKAIARIPRRNSSPGIHYKPINPKGADGTNENFRIRLPFTMPYGVSSPPRTTAVAQHSQRSAAQNSGTIPPMPSTVQNSGTIPAMPSMIQNSGATPCRSSMVQNSGAIPAMNQNSGAIPSRFSMVQNSGATPFRFPMVQNPGATPSMVQNSGATPCRNCIVQNSAASPSASCVVQMSGATPSMVHNAGSRLSMPLLDEDVPSVNFPNLSHIQSVQPTPVYAPMPLIPSITRSPSPPIKVTEQPNSNKVVTLGDLLMEEIEKAARAQEEEEEAGSILVQSSDEDSSETVKNEKEQRLPDEEVETIDLTWLDDVDPEQLQNEIEFIEVKKEEMIDEEFVEEGSHAQDPIGMAFSPTDSGISSPNVQVEYNEQVFTDRTCICGKAADYVCGCRLAMYCSDACQLKDWKSHKEVCLKHNAKSIRDTT